MVAVAGPDLVTLRGPVALRLCGLDDQRVQATVAAVERELVVDGLSCDTALTRVQTACRLARGAFLPCSFWVAEMYAVQRRQTEDEQFFARLLSIQDDLGLMSEAYDPASRRWVGDFPRRSRIWPLGTRPSC